MHKQKYNKAAGGTVTGVNTIRFNTVFNLRNWNQKGHKFRLRVLENVDKRAVFEWWILQSAKLNGSIVLRWTW